MLLIIDITEAKKPTRKEKNQTKFILVRIRLHFFKTKDWKIHKTKQKIKCTPVPKTSEQKIRNKEFTHQLPLVYQDARLKSFKTSFQFKNDTGFYRGGDAQEPIMKQRLKPNSMEMLIQAPDFPSEAWGNPTKMGWMIQAVGFAKFKQKPWTSVALFQIFKTLI